MKIVEAIVDWLMSLVISIGMWGGIYHVYGEPMERNVYTFFVIILWSFAIDSRIGRKRSEN